MHNIKCFKYGEACNANSGRKKVQCTLPFHLSSFWLQDSVLIILCIAIEWNIGGSGYICGSGFLLSRETTF